jgi:hypothetical protein
MRAPIMNTFVSPSFRSVVTFALISLAAGCAEKTALSSATAQALDTRAAPNPQLVAKIKAAYEAAVQHGGNTFEGETDADPSKLTGAALAKYQMFGDTLMEGLHADIGGVIAKVAVVDGTTVYFVAGDVSDTGSEYGFFAADGTLLALAYTGQGEEPGPGGVDWIE